MIPVSISDAAPSDFIPAGNIGLVAGIRHFIVENVRTARRFLRRCDPSFPIGDCTFCELNGHTDPNEIHSFLEPLRKGQPVGMMSEAGCPGVADPGASVAAIAQREGLKTVPLAGPSSILMSLMASGFNGQGFSFNGYLPISDAEKAKRVRELESTAAKTGMTQIFIETPYRNNRTVALLAETPPRHAALRRIRNNRPRKGVDNHAPGAPLEKKDLRLRQDSFNIPHKPTLIILA